MANPKKPGTDASLVESVAGLTAGTAATMALHPLDLVKTRMQSE